MQTGIRLIRCAINSLCKELIFLLIFILLLVGSSLYVSSNPTTGIDDKHVRRIAFAYDG
jgi:hypothetical protein